MGCGKDGHSCFRMPVTPKRGWRIEDPNLQLEGCACTFVYAYPWEHWTVVSLPNRYDDATLEDMVFHTSMAKAARNSDIQEALQHLGVREAPQHLDVQEALPGQPTPL